MTSILLYLAAMSCPEPKFVNKGEEISKEIIELVTKVAKDGCQERNKCLITLTHRGNSDFYAECGAPK